MLSTECEGMCEELPPSVIDEAKRTSSFGQLHAGLQTKFSVQKGIVVYLMIYMYGNIQ